LLFRLPSPGVTFTIFRGESLLHTCHHFFGACEEQQDEQPLQCVEHEEHIPHRLHIEQPGDQTSQPCETHQQGQSQVQMIVDPGTCGSDFSGRLGALPHQAGRRYEEDDIEKHDARKWRHKVKQKSSTRGEPA